MEFEEEEYEDPEELETSITVDDPVDVRDYIFSLYITDKLREIFILVILAGSFLSINIAIIFMGLAWYIRNSVEKHITFLQDFYNPQAVPAVVGFSGFVMLVASILGVKVGISGRFTDAETDIKQEAYFMFIYAVSAAVTFGAVLITALTCFIEISTLSSAIGDGLLAGMKKYKEEPEFKPEIDLLQINYKCCGSKSYKDWYDVSWVSSKYLEEGNGFIQQSTKEGAYMGKDVPFSCCKLEVMRPCVDTRVEDNSYHSKYNFPDDLTLHDIGCKEAVSDFLGHTIFKGVGLFVFFSSLLWGTLAVMARYLNTSMTSLSIGDSPIGWLIPYVKSKRESKPLKEVNIIEDEEAEEEESEE